MQTLVTAQATMIAYLKSQASVTSLLPSPNEIREMEWQGTDFRFPNIRVSTDYRPSINGCGVDDATFTIDVFSEAKSSLEADTIASAISVLFHKRPFTQNGLKFSTVVVREVRKAERSIYGWMARVDLMTQLV